MKMIAVVIYCFGLPAVCQALDPQVTNVLASQRPGTRLVDVTYDLWTENGQPANVNAVFSLDDGATWTITPITLSGQVGSQVAPSDNLAFVWDAGIDAPGLDVEQARVKLTACGSIPTDGIVAWYSLNGNANDMSGLGNHGTNHGAVLVTGRDGQQSHAYWFDNSSDYINIPDAPSLRLTEWTICAWVKIDQFIGRTILGKLSDANGKYNYAIIDGGSSVIRSQYELCNNDNDHYSNASGVPVGQWVFFVSRRNAATGAHSTFVNGAMSSNQIYNNIPCANARDLRLGAADYHPAFYGAMDDVRIYNRPLSDAEIMELYNE
jgi:hypothetical protein